MNRTEELARAFARVLSKWLTEKEMTALRVRNEPLKADTICASHDYCDANMAMMEAWKEVVRVPLNMQHNAHVRWWTDAWDLAKQKDFFPASVKTRKYSILITFETKAKLGIPMNKLREVAGAAFAQLEGLTDDHGIAYENAKVEADEKT